MSNEDGYMDSEVRKYFTQHLADLALKMSNIGLKQFENIKDNKFVDIKKATGHMSMKQQEYLRVYVVNYMDQLKKSQKNKDIFTNYLDNQQIFKCILPFENLTEQYRQIVMKYSVGKDQINSQIALQMYLMTIKFQIYIESDENAQNKVFSQIFTEVQQNSVLLPKVVELMPLQAQELGFLEVRRQSLEVRELSNPTEEQILELYNMDFISSIKIWINTA